MTRKRRGPKSHCKRGHELSGANVRFQVRADHPDGGVRACRECEKQRKLSQRKDVAAKKLEIILAGTAYGGYGVSGVKGLYEKYRVSRYDGKPVGECFVLSFRDPVARVVLRNYALVTSLMGNRQLGRDLTDRLDAYGAEHIAALKAEQEP